MTITCIIVEDDLLSQKSLQHLCKKIPELELIGVCSDAESVIEMLTDSPVDLLFLDVELPGLSGLQLLEKLPITPMVIFTTSKTEYAFEAFQFEAVDFLKKPIGFTRFRKAVEKAIRLMTKERTAGESTKNVFAKVDGQYVRFNHQDIFYFENIGDYVRIKTTSGNHLLHITLKKIEEKLTQFRFARVHRSYIVNLDKIEKIEENSLKVGGRNIPVSRYKKPELKQRLNIL